MFTEPPKISRSLNNGKHAFTLIEVMVVVLLLIIFLGFGATSGSAIKKQLAFFRDQQVVTAEIYKARALAIATLGDRRTVCGYGIRVVSGTKIIERFTIPKTNPTVSCEDYYASNPLQQTSPQQKQLEEAVFQTGATFGFIAPIPTVVFSSGQSACLQIQIDSVVGGVQINKFGQVKSVASCP